MPSTIYTKWERVWFLTVLLTALIVIPKMQLGFEVGKIYWFWSVVELGLVVRLLQSYRPPLSKSLQSSLLLWLAVFLLSSHLAGGDAFWGGWWRRQGFWFMLHLAGLWYLVATSSLSGRFMARGIQLVAMIVALLGFLDHGRSAGSLVEANSFGLIAALGTIVAIYERSASAAVTFLGVVMSQSRSAILALGSLILSRRTWGWIVLPIFLIIIGLTFARGGGERMTVWLATLGLWRERPWLGIGLDNFQSVFWQHMHMRGAIWRSYDQPHNLVLWLLVSTGSLGLAAISGWLYIVWSQIRFAVWKNLILALVVYGLFQPLSTTVWVYLFVILGAGVCAKS
jgi:hypothetical protein